MKTLKLALTTLLFTSLFATGAVYADDATVAAQGLKYKPFIVKISPGDTVHWTNMSIHNVHMMFVPKGADAFRSTIGEEVNHKFDKEGIYVYQCDPHIGYGMGGVVIVGKPANLDALKADHASGALGMILHKAIKAGEKM